MEEGERKEEQMNEAPHLSVGDAIAAVEEADEFCCAAVKTRRTPSTSTFCTSLSLLSSEVFEEGLSFRWICSDERSEEFKDE